MLEPAMTVRQVADYLNVAPKVVYRLVQQGDLPGFKVAGTWRFKRSDIDGWIEDQKRRVMPADPARAEVRRRITHARLRRMNNQRRSLEHARERYANRNDHGKILEQDH